MPAYECVVYAYLHREGSEIIILVPFHSNVARNGAHTITCLQLIVNTSA